MLLGCIFNSRVREDWIVEGNGSVNDLVFHGVIMERFIPSNGNEASILTH